MAQLTNQQKEQIVDLIKDKVQQLGTIRAVSIFCKVSDGALSQMLQKKYDVKGDDLFIKVGNALGWRAHSATGTRDWVTVETTDTKNICKICADAKKESLFLAIADNAGGSKTESLKYFYEKQKRNDVYYIRCMDWGKTDFMNRLCRTLGISVGSSFNKPNEMLEMVIEFFQERAANKPMLIVDEANKLKDSSLRCFIPLYNECEDFLGVVLAGPRDLKRYIDNSVRWEKRGFEEIYSRIGNKFIQLLGHTLSEVITICRANGYHDEERIKEKFEEHKPVSKIITVNGQEVRIRVLRDLRWIKTFVKINRTKNT